MLLRKRVERRRTRSVTVRIIRLLMAVSFTFFHDPGQSLVFSSGSSLSVLVVLTQASGFPKQTSILCDTWPFVPTSFMGLPLSAAAGGDRCLDAFVVALNQACEGRKNSWYTSTLELQLASLEFCKACRSVSTLRVLVDTTTPRSLMWAAEPLDSATSEVPTPAHRAGFRW